MLFPYCFLGLYGDGSFLLLEQLTKTTFWLGNPARTTASYLTQAPTVFALKAGLRDLKPLLYVHSLGLVLPVLFWLAALYVQRATELFWLFLLGFVVSFLTSGFALSGEYNFAAALCGLAASILLRQDRMGLPSAIVLLLTSVGLLKAYESSVFLAPLLILFCGARLYLRLDAAPQIVLIGISAILFAIGAAIAAQSILHPVNPNLLAGALDLSPFRSRHFRFLAGLGLIAILATRLHGRSQTLFLVLSVTFALTYLLVPKWWVPPHMHYLNRTLSAVCLFTVLAVSGMFVLASRWGYKFQLSNAAPIVVAGYIATGSVFGVHLFGFRQWLAQFEREIIGRSGVVPIDSTALSPSPYGWEWSNPSLSSVLKGRSPGATIANASNYTNWEPFSATDAPVVDLHKSAPLF